MENIVEIKGKVKYPITLDPGVWIFDDRRVELTEYFADDNKGNDNNLEEYTKAISKHWDREIMEGAVYPPTLKSEKKYERQKVLTGSFGIPLKPFLANAEPLDSADTLVLHTEVGEIEISLDEGRELILGFSHKGKPLKENGPVHVYFGDGTNHTDPIKDVKGISIK